MPLAPPRYWWQGMGDAMLAQLIERGLAQAPLSPGARDELPSRMAQAYIDLRARQTALVLLARREELNAQLVTIAQQRPADGAAPRQPVEAALAQWAATQADQARARLEIAALRERLAVLAGATPGALADLPGGPIPLPPAQAGASEGSGAYGAARIAESTALTQAAQAGAVAAQQSLQARAGTLPPADAIKSDLRALNALAAEEQARAAMTRAFVALAATGRHARRDH